MAPSSALRSFAITLAIAITLFGPGASGFTIDRTKSSPNKRTQAIDLLSEETIDLPVTDEIRTPNDTKARKNEDSSNSTTISDTTISQDTQNASKAKTEKALTSTQATTIRSTTEFVKIPTISSDTVEVFDSVEDTSFNNKSEITKESLNDSKSTLETTLKPVDSKPITSEISDQTKQPFEPTITVIDVITKIDKTETMPRSLRAIETTTPIPMTTVSVEAKEITIPMPLATGSFETKETTTPMPIATGSFETKEITTPMPVATRLFETKETTRPMPIATGLFEAKETTTPIPITTGSFEAKDTTIPMLVSTEKPMTTTNIGSVVTNSNPKETVDITSADNTMITTDLPEPFPDTTILSPIPINDTKLPESTFPDSKTPTTSETTVNKFKDPFFDKYTKYTTIIRKRVTSSEELTATTQTEEEAMKAETSNTAVNFEKVFNATLIPSLEELRVELLSNANQPSINTEKPLGTEKATLKLLSPTVDILESTIAKRPGIVQTKRAGYLDNSEKTTTPLAPFKSSEENVTTSKDRKEIDTITNVEDSEAAETESPHPEKVSGSESQSQLAEDAIQEELLKEEALHNFEENSKRYQEASSHEVKPISKDSSSVATVPNSPSSDDLSVQPIEKYKTTLYTVSPNYKPMKKLDVQPAKPFVRDPDDNSWRNESISSLGIVFKPKNSSKSFKEVLKNKTQIELNNLIERAKDEVPDLRVRLEKIAEVRKTKKKKMNKDGEVVYTDYEESNSGEISSTPKLDLLSSLLSSDEVYKLITPSNTHTNPELTTPTTTVSNTEEKLKKNKTTTPSIFSSLGLDQLTTTKQDKFFNAAEYYDTTDEYDADYVTMSKIDLKKFTMPPPRTMPPLPPQTTKTIKPHIPERRPTVQYFPPREPQKVNVNNIDEDFERKVNLFSFKQPPRMEPRPFITVPSVPIATEQPRPEIRPLLSMRAPPRPDGGPGVKPADFAVIPPLDPNRNYYVTSAPRSTEPQDGLLMPEAHLHRGSYVIKHYKDFLTAAAKGDEEQRRDDFLPFHGPEPHTASPEREPSASSAAPNRPTFPSVDEEDYDTQFRKEVLTRFVENFNQNSERFKVDFPILYNNSVVHRHGSGAPAASRAFLKRLYPAGVATRPSSLGKKPCEPNCELTVELSPAYELHYYVPGQEEREEQEPRTMAAPYRYGL